MTKLNPEEKNLLDSVENNEWRTINNFENMKQIYQNYALSQVNENPIEINLSSEDMEKLKQLSNQLNQSVSNLSQDILHKYLQGQLVEKNHLNSRIK